MIPLKKHAHRKHTRKVSLIPVLLSLLLISCETIPQKSILETESQQEPVREEIQRHEEAEPKVIQKTQEKINIVALLPLTGKGADIGQDISHGLSMSIQKYNKIHLEYTIYDTEGSETKAVQQLIQALKTNPNLIIGPLTTQETKAVGKYLQEKQQRLPLLALTNDISALDSYNNAFALGLTPEHDMNVMMQYMSALRNDKDSPLRYGVLAPENTYGRAIVKAVSANIKAGESALTTVIIYDDKKTNGIAEDIQKLVNRKELEAYNDSMEELRKEYPKGIPESSTVEKPVPPKPAIDVLVIGQWGRKVLWVTSFMEASDIDLSTVQIIGNSNWYNLGNGKLYGDSITKRAYFPYKDPQKIVAFHTNYEQQWESTPTLFALMGADIVDAIMDMQKRNIPITSQGIIEGGIYATSMGSVSFNDKRIAMWELVPVMPSRRGFIKAPKKPEPRLDKNVPTKRE